MLDFDRICFFKLLGTTRTFPETKDTKQSVRDSLRYTVIIKIIIEQVQSVQDFLRYTINTEHIYIYTAVRKHQDSQCGFFHATL
jgi:hypothetical protein